MKKINKSINSNNYTDAILKLVNIKKDYPVVGNNEPVHALKGINISFRTNEFVSILGPSGCGKTTLLNIIGGLDKYSDGDLIISSRSTKQFTDRDWDVYRNHRIGFIFQSYNLIPHQTILGNVELALTIAGMSKKERIEKAKRALDKVGLANQYDKHPNQLSGGQCQRVAIARALVNEPEILLADEPTGALDTVTSQQIMDLIAEISKEKLVIMVTHNPDIAEKYSSRIIRLLDGKVIDDSNPFKEKIIPSKKIEIKNEKAKMSFFTAFRLSLRNLVSKLKRTILVCIAGSIGIVGVSTVLAVSSGVHNYIESMQDDMLSGNPVTISEVAYDLNNMISDMSSVEQTKIVVENGFVNVNSLVEYLIKQSQKMSSFRVENEIKEEYIEYLKNMPKESYAAMNFDYGLDISNNIFTDWKYDGTSQSESMSVAGITKMYTSVLEDTEYSSYSSYISQLNVAISQAPNNNDYILSQYDLLDGKIATNEDEIMVVINKNNQLTDVVLAQLGYYTQKEFINIVFKATEDDAYNKEYDKTKFSFDEILNREFRWYPNDSIFKKDPNMLDYLNAYNPFSCVAYENDIDNNKKDDKMTLKVVGILQPKENISFGCLQAGFYYTEAFTQKMIGINKNSEIIQYYNEINENSENPIDSITSGLSTGIPGMETPIPIDMGVTFNYRYKYNDDTPFKDVKGYLGSETNTSLFASLMQSLMPSPGDSGSDTDNSTSNKFYSISLRQLGGNDLPNFIAIYPIDFDNKDLVTHYLDEWNDENVKIFDNNNQELIDRKKITYSDNLELVINMINTMINIITWALVVFTALSLVVSTVMIGIITYVSVVERIKEIGVIRSLGGRKKDVSALFIAETFIIGLASGLMGIAITLIFSLIINVIVGQLSGIYTIAALQFKDAIIMIIVSIILTLISGVFPARAAARKDPVEALRIE